MDLRPGDTVFGATQAESYEIIRPIGNGSFGLVYEIRNPDGESFALKTISTAFLGIKELEALINEGELATQIQHENVARVFFFHDGRQHLSLPPYMIMEYANEGTLQDVLDDREARQEYFDSDELSELFLRLASGMKAVNEKLVHRDIKPDNILIHEGVLKIADFGLSKVVGVATRTRTFKGINHALYCAPEAWRSEANLPAMDMYSMGIVFYELATLRHPYQVTATGDFFDEWRKAHLFQPVEDPRRFNSSLDIGLGQLITKMLSKSVESRYKSWDEVIQRLANNDTEGETKRDVSKLVEKAVQTHQRNERMRLKAEDEARRKKENKELIAYSFKTIIAAAEETVEAFNRQSDYAKLKVTTNPLGSAGEKDLHLMIHREWASNGGVYISVKPVYEEHELDGQKVKAWGYAREPNGKGFNLVLVSRGPEDLYGYWRALHVRYRIGPGYPTGVEPFPFELKELPREIRLFNSAHVYITERRDFKPEFLDPLIEELL